MQVLRITLYRGVFHHGEATMKSATILAALLLLALATCREAAANEALFKSRCQPCHGSDGKGTGIAPSLADSQFMRTATDDDLAGSFLKGRLGPDRKYPEKYPAGMPPQDLSDGEARAMVEYMKRLAGR